jgi:sugar phosphate isomerase/epimerase
MYSVREHMAADPIATTRAVGEIGYRYLEYANLTEGDPGVGFEADPGELREVVAAGGGEVVSSHVWPLTERNVGDIISYHKDLGTKYIVTKMLYRNLDDILDQVPTMISVGEKLASAGMGHLLHTALMRSSGSRVDLDTILEAVPADLLGIELDTYWALRSGLDPVETIKRYGERISILHQKDIPAHIDQPVNILDEYPDDEPLLPENIFANRKYVAEDNFIELGAGTMDLQGIIDAANIHTRAEYLFVEQDYTKLDELESVSVSLNALRGRNGVEL